MAATSTAAPPSLTRGQLWFDLPEESPNVGILAVWALSRPVGTPWDHSRSAHPSLGRADLASTALEIAGVAAAAVLLTALVTVWGLEPAASGGDQHHGSDAGHSLGSG